MSRLGVREAVRLAQDHALGILESTDDLAFWGEEFYLEHDVDSETMTAAKKVILNRIRRVK